MINDVWLSTKWCLSKDLSDSKYKAVFKPLDDTRVHLVYRLCLPEYLRHNAHRQANLFYQSLRNVLAFLQVVAKQFLDPCIDAIWG